MIFMARIQSAEKTFVFNLNPSNNATIAEDARYIDIGQVHSLVNRFSARQGFAWVVDSIEIGVQGGGAFEAAIYRLPQHWPCVNAWEKTMRHWLEQQDDALDAAGLESRVCRYRDFKIFYDAVHANGGTALNLLPSGFLAVAPPTGGYDWNASQVVVPNDGGVAGNTQEYFLHMLGNDNPGANPSKGMIKAYADSRTRPFTDDPNIVDVPSGGLFGEMEDVGEIMDEVTLNAVGSNDQPPYVIDVDTADEFYPGGANQGNLDGQFVDLLAVNAGQNYNTDTCGSFIAPAGLIKIRYNATGVAVPGVPEPGDMPYGIWLKMKLVPGEYKGAMALSMQELN